MSIAENRFPQMADAGDPQAQPWQMLNGTANIHMYPGTSFEAETQVEADGSYRTSVLKVRSAYLQWTLFGGPAELERLANLIDRYLAALAQCEGSPIPQPAATDPVGIQMEATEPDFLGPE